MLNSIHRRIQQFMMGHVIFGHNVSYVLAHNGPIGKCHFICYIINNYVVWQGYCSVKLYKPIDQSLKVYIQQLMVLNLCANHMVASVPYAKHYATVCVIAKSQSSVDFECLDPETFCSALMVLTCNTSACAWRQGPTWSSYIGTPRIGPSGEHYTVQWKGSGIRGRKSQLLETAKYTNNNNNK